MKNDKELQPGLYIVALPIGNSRDITLRAIETLSNVDEIYCEDTRVTMKILNIYEIKNKLKTYHDHNGEKVRPRIIEKILRGKRIALVADAGTPLISDPGYKLVVEARDKKIYVTTCPGASAPIAALSISGMPTDRFFFLGFLPLKEMNRAKILEEVKNIHSTLVFFEAPNRLERTLEEIFLFLGNRPVSICREISKKFEEIIKGNIKDLLRNFELRKFKGEIVIILRGAEHSTNDTGNLEDLIFLSEGNFSTSEKAKKISKITGLSKKDVYDRIIKLDNLKQKI